MLNEYVLSLIKNSKGEFILNWEFAHRQMALLIREGKYIIMDLDGCEWSFDKFEQACYFAILVNIDHGQKWEEDWNKRYKKNYIEALEL